MRLEFFKEKIIFLAPVLLVLLVFFIPVSPTLKSILLIPCLMALVVIPYYREYLYFTFNTFWARAALALFLYIVIACLWSEASSSMQFNLLDKYSKLVFLPILAVGFIKPQTRQWVLNSYLLIMLLTCLLSIGKAQQLLALTSMDDPGEVFYNHIVTGYMIALAVYLAGIQVFKSEFSVWSRLFYLSVLLLGSYQIFFINTGRTGYLVYVILMSALIIQKMQLRKAIIGIIMLGGMSVLVYYLSSSMQMTVYTAASEMKQLQHHQENNSLGFRLQFHQYAKSLFEQHPLIGIGTGGFQYRFSQDQPIPAWGKKLNEPHSQYWLTLAEQGLIGIVLLCCFLGALLWTLPKLKETRAVFLGIWISFCMVSFSDTVFCYSPVGYLLIVFSALCFGELIEKHYLKS